MPQYLHRGQLPPKRHTAFPQQGGYKNEGIYYEEVVTLSGFGRAYSIVYHLKPPTRVRKIEPAGESPMDLLADPALRHHHVKTKDLPAGGDPIGGRVPIMGNSDVTLLRCRPTKPQPELYRNANCDEVLFIHRGKGTLHSMFGPLPFKPYDYVVIPRCTTYRVEFDAGTQPDLLIIEACSNLTIPPRYLNPDGQLRLGAPYYERDFHGPTDAHAINEDKDVSVLIKHGHKLSRYIMASHPFDVVGWDGLVYPYTFNADDFEPVTGKVHQPPPVQQTFDAQGFVVCTFAPRMLDYHPQAIKVPYAHSNVQADEVLYYVRGKFGSRRGVDEASFTLHPRGIPHGPHPGTIVASRDVTFTDELAVMVDTEKPLYLTKQALGMDDPQYPFSWLE